MENKVTIKIPRELYLKLSSMIAGTGFSSVTDFITFVMRGLASGGDLMGEDNLTAEEIKAVREQLRKLGYLWEETTAKERKGKAVYLPAELYELVAERVKTAGFASVEEYVTFVLSEVLQEDVGGEAVLNDEQEEEVKKRLRSLGYLD